MQVKKVFIAGDHAAFSAKEEAKIIISALGFEVCDLGVHDDTMSVDYPDFANAMASEIYKECEILSGTKFSAGEILDSTKFGVYGVLICGTGIGISIAANRHTHIRCALCHDTLTAKLAREHNNANVLAFGARVLGVSEYEYIIKAFFSTEFSGGRHERRVSKLGVIACPNSAE